ncbi:MAG: ribose 5-phosphate isomerase B [Candidatus Riflebacteria bacterium HGW-Riflebacteria-2]|jgi:ribose 5-phosphate isomerase B|nr:MAG: ribose 5-phosphate isomerase B [Candidatus Riflebacteria bacterium HGW-Riflebacteria-2]
MKIYAGSDHGGFLLKQTLIKRLGELGHEVVDLGTDGQNSCDYPDYAHAVAEKILSEPGSMGVLTCGSGIGISIAANRHAGIRAALCHNSLEASLARQHNNANVLVMGGRLVGEALALDILEKFFSTSFDGGRHQARIEKIEIPCERQNH